MGVVGVVPLGIIGAAWHTDWSAVIFLVVGFALTFGARLFAAWLMSVVEEASYKAAELYD